MIIVGIKLPSSWWLFYSSGLMSTLNSVLAVMELNAEHLIEPVIINSNKALRFTLSNYGRFCDWSGMHGRGARELFNYQ